LVLACPPKVFGGDSTTNKPIKNNNKKSKHRIRWWGNNRRGVGRERFKCWYKEKQKT